jgi:hypothetical protein
LARADVIREVDALSVQDKAALRAHLEASDTHRVNDEIVRRLRERGFTVHSPTPPQDPSLDDDDFEPIEVKGKPVSETIIEERR